jgi:hypothetical protein
MAAFIFKELNPVVVAPLDELTLWTEQTAEKAAMFIRSLDHGCMVALEVLNIALAIVKPLSMKSQGIPQYNHNAVASVTE